MNLKICILSNYQFYCNIPDFTQNEISIFHLLEKRVFFFRYEKEGRSRKQVKARDLWLLITQLQSETGTPYIVYKDHCNHKSNHQNIGTIKCGGFSTEVVQYSSSDEVAVCNTASIAVNMFVNSTKKIFDFYKLKEVAKVITYNLDKMIDVNCYPLPEAQLSSHRHRSIGMLLDAFITYASCI
jgi:ribonucleoside-diphosphate reductase subunit M1